MSHQLPLILGAAIRSRRKLLGLSQEDLAFGSGLHRTYVADLERGARNPSLASIAKIAKALTVSLSELFTNVKSEDEKVIELPRRGMSHDINRDRGAIKTVHASCDKW